MATKPFLKWAGGKTKVLEHILPLIGDSEHFIEPFAGSLAVGLNVPSKVCVLNDVNAALMDLYKILIGEGEEFVDYCESFFDGGNQSDFIMRIEIDSIKQKIERKVCSFFYLNRHGFNGLTRYNKVEI